MPQLFWLENCTFIDLDFDNHLNLNRNSHMKVAYSDRRSGMSVSVTQDFYHETRGTVDDFRLPVKIRGIVDKGPEISPQYVTISPVIASDHGGLRYPR